MKQNVGGIDRIIRLVVGIALIAWGVVEGSWWGAIGIIPLFTAVVSFCPFYPLLGISTKKEQ